MIYRLGVAALLFAAVIVLLVGLRDDEPDPRLEALDARIDSLTARLDLLEQRRQSDKPAPNTATDRTGSEPAIQWRFGPGLDGIPLLVAEKTFDRRRGRVEILLQIKAALTDADDWSTQPGQSVPAQLTVKDVTGAVVSDRSMTLLRGASHEPGAFLHLAAELPPQSAHRVSLIELRAESGPNPE
jgi:hypothetical protein